EISPGLAGLPLYGKTAFHDMTVSCGNRPSALMTSCVNPSAKYSRPGSALWFTNGRIAIDGLVPAAGRSPAAPPAGPPPVRTLPSGATARPTPPAARRSAAAHTADTPNR